MSDLPSLPAVADEYIWLSGIADPEVFGCRLVGDSMEPEYRVGDLVVFSPTLVPVSGECCFVQYETDHGPENTFKRVSWRHAGDEDGDFVLEPLNPLHPTIVLPRDRITVLAAAVCVIRELAQVPNRRQWRSPKPSTEPVDRPAPGQPAAVPTVATPVGDLPHDHANDLSNLDAPPSLPPADDAAQRVRRGARGLSAGAWRG